jgi:pimeloyl-ACP methyl ester carboxylesterase
MIIACSESMTCAASSFADLSILYGPVSSKKLIVFVHGFNSDPSSAWTNDAGISWPDLMRDDKNFNDYTVATYRYDTSLLNRTSSIEEIAVRMHRQIEDKGVFEKYKEIYFIAHSMGGIVAKRVLVELYRPNQIDKLGKIKAVLFIATPVQGSSFAELASYISLNPQLAGMKPSEFNDFLQSLENQYQNLMRDRLAPAFPRSFCAYETKPTYGTVTVSRRDAATTCDQTPIAVDANHTNIVKPISRDSTIYDWARARILETSVLSLKS